MQRRERDVARALIVSPDSRILLVKIDLSDRSFWITPGGGLQAGEDHHGAILRELGEEIGRSNWDIGAPVWTRSHSFDFEGEALTQHEIFHWVPSEWFDPPTAMPDQHENQYFGGFRWWRRAAPRKIAIYFQALLTEGLPDAPIDVGV